MSKTVAGYLVQLSLGTCGPLFNDLVMYALFIQQNILSA